MNCFVCLATTGTRAAYVIVAIPNRHGRIVSNGIEVCAECIERERKRIAELPGETYTLELPQLALQLALGFLIRELTEGESP